MIRVVNLKQPVPNASWAVYTLEHEIDCAKLEGVGVIVFIHGYGAGGKGGVIKRAVRKKLEELKKLKKINIYIAGERFSDCNEDKKLLCKKHPELILHSQVQNLNSGITVVEVEV